MISKDDFIAIAREEGVREDIIPILWERRLRAAQDLALSSHPLGIRLALKLLVQLLPAVRRSVQ
jgi:hypothetical protein